MSFLDHTYAIVLAGGGGTRLWPKSRKQSPKQFLRLIGKDTLLQVTVSRINKLVPSERIIIVTNQLYRDEVVSLLPEVPSDNIIAEPEKRDTALAMLTGALYARSKDPEAVVINCASDHVVTNESEFIRVMKAAAEVANDNDYLVAVGITPTFPSTGFGYIKIGDDLKKLDRGLSLFKVESFTEKPNEATARAFISTGKYFWNANMYVWRAKVLVEAFQKHHPELLESANKLLDLKGEGFIGHLPDVYKDAQAISIDYAISEKADNLVLIPGDFGWNDVGDWRVVYDLETKDLSGNVVLGEGSEVHALSIESHNNLIHTNGRLVALVGINDLVVIDTDEILMICPKNKTQEVKRLVDRLKEEKRQEYL